MNRKLLMGMVFKLLLMFSVLVFGYGFYEANVVNSTLCLSLGVIGFLLFLQLKSK